MVEADQDGRWKQVYWMAISASRPRDLAAKRNWVPFPTGPGMTFADRTMSGLQAASVNSAPLRVLGSFAMW